MLLSEAIEALALATRADGRSPRTVESYRQKLKPLLAFSGDVEVASIRVTDLRRYVAHLRDRTKLYTDHPTHREREGHLSPFTVASMVTSTKRLFNWLVEEGVLEASPMKRIKIPRPKRREPKGISSPDFLALLATTDEGRRIDLRDRALMMFLFDTGCRAGGVCGLRIDDVDFGRGLAAVTEKGGKTRLVPFTGPTAADLEEWLQVRPRDRGPWVFVGLGVHSKGGLTPNSLCQAIKRRAERAGVTGPVNPHAFRHGFAKHYLMSGGDLASVSQLMGHASLEITKDYYVQYTVSELREKHRQHSPIVGIFGGDDGSDDS